MPNRNAEPSEFVKGLIKRAAHYDRKKISGRDARRPTEDEKGYNGWKNYETWAVALWIDNGQRIQQEATAIVVNSKDEYGAAQELKDWIEEGNPLIDTASLYSDLLNAALSEVDWYEVANHYRNE